MLPRFRFCLFVILGLLDWLLTRRLVGPVGSLVYESNPVARACLASFGWAGLLVFKLSCTLAVAATWVAVARRRPDLARRLANFACAVTAVVVGYSTLLVVLGPARVYGQSSAEIARLDGEGDRLSQQLCECHAYSRAQEQVIHELLAGRCTLGRAADCLSRMPYVRSRGFRVALPWLCEPEELPPTQRVALRLIRHALARLRGPARPALQARLLNEYQAAYGSRVPAQTVL